MSRPNVGAPGTPPGLMSRPKPVGLWAMLAELANIRASARRRILLPPDSSVDAFRGRGVYYASLLGNTRLLEIACFIDREGGRVDVFFGGCVHLLRRQAGDEFFMLFGALHGPAVMGLRREGAGQGAILGTAQLLLLKQSFLGGF